MTDLPRNETLDALRARKSVRVFTAEPVTQAEYAALIEAAMQAPTAGAQQLYTILHITDAARRARLAELCDHQPFIAQAPLVLKEAQAVVDLLGLGFTVPADAVHCVGGFWQPKYSLPNAAMVEAVFNSYPFRSRMAPSCRLYFSFTRCRVARQSTGFPACHSRASFTIARKTLFGSSTASPAPRISSRFFVKNAVAIMAVNSCVAWAGSPSIPACV